MTSDHHIHHEIDYIELVVTDMAQAKRFYEAAFDWAFTDYGPGYAGIQKRRGGEAGGLRLGSGVTTGGPLVILYSKDFETTLRRVRRAGGEITEEPFEFPGGTGFTSGTRVAMSSRSGPKAEILTHRGGDPPPFVKDLMRRLRRPWSGSAQDSGAEGPGRQGLSSSALAVPGSVRTPARSV